MKKIRILTCFILLILIAAGWLSSYAGLGGKSIVQLKAACREHMDAAADYEERRLYERAIEELTFAAEIEDSDGLQNHILDLYEKWYAEENSNDVLERYAEAARKAANGFSNNRDLSVEAVEILLKAHSYYQANKIAEMLVKNNPEDEQCRELLMQTRYAYSVGYSSYSDIRGLSGGYYCVSNRGMWGYITASGGNVRGCSLIKGFQAGENGVRLQVDEEQGAYIIDGNGVMQGRIDFIPDRAGAYSEGLIPISKDGTYGYYSLIGDYCFGEYHEAGSFYEQKAAVLTGEGWILIDQNGEQVSRKIYKDILLTQDGSWCAGKRMIADDGEGYALYDEDEVQIGDFSCEDMDRPAGGTLFAFKKAGKWGYVDRDGNIVIEPEYQKARSFSNGLGAVKKEGLWGYIDSEGEAAIPFQFSDADYFSKRGSCFVKMEDNAWRLLTMALQ